MLISWLDFKGMILSGDLYLLHFFTGEIFVPEHVTCPGSGSEAGAIEGFDVLR